MSGIDTRNSRRDSLLLLADVRFHDSGESHRVKVRNLSATGMMADGDRSVAPGTRLTVELRNLPPVDGTVAWVQDRRFGIAFAHEIDPHAARTPIGNGDLASPRYVRPSSIPPVGAPTGAGPLRKV